MEQAQINGRLGEKVDALSHLAETADKFDVSVTFELKSGLLATYRIVQKVPSGAAKMFFAELLGLEELVRPSFKLALRDIINSCDKVSKLKALVIKTSNCPVPAKEVRKLAIEAWSELVGIEAAPESAVGKDVETTKDRQESTRQQFIDDLRGGADGIARWHQRSNQQTNSVKHLKNCNFSGADMTGVSLFNRNLSHFEGCNFENTNLSQSNLDRCYFEGSNFRNAIMNGASISQIYAPNSDFSGSVLKDANCSGSVFQGAKLCGTDLTNANLFYADLRGADLSNAILSGVSFSRTNYDENTVFPIGFLFPGEGLQFAGKGRDPMLAQRVKALAPAGGHVDFDTFVNRLDKEIDQERLKKAIKMLKAESFQLFAEVKTDSLVGVVKSQTDPDLVYSCRLTDTGTYACCTQNLNTCGGLRGFLCKHLLVLLIGITKSGQLDAASACEWIMASKRFEKAQLDKEIMSTTFLRYKGAEAGEIDWRPTETMPEDYYAY